MTDAATIPTSIAEAEIEILGTKLTVHVLDNGQRVISEEDMLRFLGLMAGDHTDLDICEVCSKPLAEGDLGHRCADGPVLCEDHAPTFWRNTSRPQAKRPATGHRKRWPKIKPLLSPASMPATATINTSGSSKAAVDAELREAPQGA